ncbi:MAG: hypothetical protein A2V66_04585 [Ignavibacteria bacterium RBG_13_36_8]|nr:MAG: hypothetical protein A2V66_04585 [Ignavibacteria bacterium RBG_13_36_8]
MNNISLNATDRKNTKSVPIWVSAIATSIIALTSIVGVCFIVKELNDSQIQTELLSRTLMQSYRPLGIIQSSFKPNEQGLVILQYLFNKEKKDCFAIGYEPMIKNEGKGILSLLGYIALLSKDVIDFRHSFLDGEVKEVTFDRFGETDRRVTIPPGGTFGISVLFEDVFYETKYVMYILALYEDQDGNLYDTESMNILWLEKATVTVDGLRTKSDKTKTGVHQEKYHCFSSIEKEKLLTQLRKLKNPIADVILSNL